jgi:MFS family permease
VGLLVVVYQRDGAVGVGILGAVRMLPAILGGAVSAAALARLPARRLLVGIAAWRAIGSGLIALAMATTGSSWPLIVLAGVVGAAGALVRPAQATLMPALARSPSELVAANVAWGSFEGLGSFAGPFAAGLLVAGGFELGVPILAAVGFALTVLIVGGLRFEQALDDEADAASRGLGLIEGLRALARRPVPRWSMGGVYLQTLTRGLLNSLLVVASVTLLGLGDPGVGLLTAVMGIGGLVGGPAALSLVQSNRLVLGFAMAMAGWGLPLAVIGVIPSPIVAVLAMAVVGVANAAFDVAGFTIFQRGCANEERASVFSVFEGTAALGVVSGSLLGPVLLAAFGGQGALVVTGLILPIFAVVAYARTANRATVTVVDEDVVGLLRAVPAFTQLPLTAVERLAGAIRSRSYAAGMTVMREGDAGDEFLVIERGEVEVSIGGRVVHRLGRGSGIGEIALLRRSSRTATVVALTDVQVVAIAASDFYRAISGPATGAAMERMASSRVLAAE